MLWRFTKRYCVILMFLKGSSSGICFCSGSNACTSEDTNREELSISWKRTISIPEICMKKKKTFSTMMRTTQCGSDCQNSMLWFLSTEKKFRTVRNSYHKKFLTLNFRTWLLSENKIVQNFLHLCKVLQAYHDSKTALPSTQYGQ